MKHKVRRNTTAWLDSEVDRLVELFDHLQVMHDHTPEQACRVALQSMVDKVKRRHIG
jgi:nitrogen-specific signal transduction histidine kinase